MIPVILDTDIGAEVDDALALALAVHSPEIDILAITTVGIDVRLRGRISRKLLRVFGRDYSATARKIRVPGRRL